MKVTDLPEPKRPVYSPEEETKRHWELVVAFISLITFYAILHKLFIPLGLKLTHLRTSPYSHIDWFFIQPLLIFILLRKENRNTYLISLLCGFGILFGPIEIIETAEGQYQGWLAISRLLSSVPMAAACGYLMTLRQPQRSFQFAWLGACLVMLSVFSRNQFTSWANLFIPSAPTAIVPTRTPPTIEALECGSRAFTVAPGLTLSAANSITIENCGFSPQAVLWKSGTLEVTNHTDHPVNIHWLEFSQNHEHSKWNFMLPPGASRVSPLIDLQAGEAGMLFSDSNPEAGLAAFLPNNRTEQWLFSRQHIRKEPVKK